MYIVLIICMDTYKHYNYKCFILYKEYFKKQDKLQVKHLYLRELLWSFPPPKENHPLYFNKGKVKPKEVLILLMYEPNGETS